MSFLEHNCLNTQKEWLSGIMLSKIFLNSTGLKAGGSIRSSTFQDTALLCKLWPLDGAKGKRLFIAHLSNWGSVLYILYMKVSLLPQNLFPVVAFSLNSHSFPLAAVASYFVSIQPPFSAKTSTFC